MAERRLLGYAAAMTTASGPIRPSEAPETDARPLDEVVGLPADGLANLLEQALDDAAPSPPEPSDIPAAFASGTVPYRLEDLLCGLPPIDADDVPTVALPPDEEAAALPAPAEAEAEAETEAEAATEAGAEHDDVLVLDEQMEMAAAASPSEEPEEEDEEEDDGKDTDRTEDPKWDPSGLTMGNLVAALHALADDAAPPAPGPARTDAEDDDVFLLTEEYESPATETSRGPDDTMAALTDIVSALRTLAASGTVPPIALEDEAPPAAPPPSEDAADTETGTPVAPDGEGEAAATPEQSADTLSEPQQGEPPRAGQTDPGADSVLEAALRTRIDDIVAAHQPVGIPQDDRGDTALPERLDALQILLAEPPPAQDFAALDALYACWPKGTQDCDSRALLAVAHNLSRNFGLPGKLPMASVKAWRMLSPRVFEAELAKRLTDVGAFISEWQGTQRHFLILEFGEIELIEYLFEALHPGYHAELLAGVMNFKVLSNRRMGLLRRIPNRIKKQITPLLPDGKERALMELAHAKALLEQVAVDTGFAPIAETAAKAQEEVEKMMKAVANIGAPPPPPPPGGGLALGRIG